MSDYLHNKKLPETGIIDTSPEQGYRVVDGYSHRGGRAYANAAPLPDPGWNGFSSVSSTATDMDLWIGSLRL